MPDKIQMTGSQLDLGGGNTEKMDSFSGGTIQAEFTGDAPLRRSNNPLGQFTDQPMGTIQNDFTGTVPLSRKPHRGYESGTPINMQDENPDTGNSY